MRVTEEFMLCLLDEDVGMFHEIAPQAVNSGLAGAVLMDLQLEDMIKVDGNFITLKESIPTGDDLLDPTLSDIVRLNEPQSHTFWVRHIAEHGSDIRRKTAARLIDKGILNQSDGGGFLYRTHSVSRSRRYLSQDGKLEIDVKLRIVRELLENETTNSRDAAIISLADACNILKYILSEEDMVEASERITQISQTNPIAQSVKQIIQIMSPPPKPPEPKEIPMMKGRLPWIGSFIDLAWSPPEFVIENYKKLGPVFRAPMPKIGYITIIVGKEANLFFLRHGHFYLSPNNVWSDFIKQTGSSRFIFSMDGHEHTRLRRAQVNGLSRSLLLDNIPKAVEIIHRHIDKWEGKKSVTGFLSFQQISTDLLGTLAVGYPPGEYTDDIIKYTNLMLSIHVSRHKPNIYMRSKKFRRAKNRVDEFLNKIIKEYKERSGVAPKSHSLGKGKTNLIEDMFNLHNDDPTFMPEMDFRANLLMPFGAGLDTVSASGAFILYLLLKNPETQDRLREEVDALFANGMPTEEGLQKMDIMHRVAKEAMRMYPPVHTVRRKVINSFDFEGYHIPVGDIVLVGTTCTHHMSEFFPEPDKFDIDRFTNERAEHKKPGVYAPFGLGSHRCLGSGFAEIQMALVISTIIRYTNLELTPKNYNLKIDPVPFYSPDKNFKFKLASWRD